MEKLNESILYHIVKFLDKEKCICHNCEVDNLILCSKYYLKTLKKFINYTKPFNSKKYKCLLYTYHKMYICPKHFVNFTQKEIMIFEEIYDIFKKPTTISTFIHRETTEEMNTFIRKLSMVCNMFIFTYSFSGNHRRGCCGGKGQKFIKRRRYEQKEKKNDFSYDSYSKNKFSPEYYLQI